jgi:hypothetical protein
MKQEFYLSRIGGHGQGAARRQEAYKCRSEARDCEWLRGAILPQGNSVWGVTAAGAELKIEDDIDRSKRIGPFELHR